MADSEIDPDRMINGDGDAQLMIVDACADLIDAAW